MKNENKWSMIYVLYLISTVSLIVLDVNCEYDNRMFCMKYRVKHIKYIKSCDKMDLSFHEIVYDYNQLCVCVFIPPPRYT